MGRTLFAMAIGALILRMSPLHLTNNRPQAKTWGFFVEGPKDRSLTGLWRMATIKADEGNP